MMTNTLPAPATASIGVGATFFKAGLLKYNSFEFTVRLFAGLATRVARSRHA